MQLNTTLSPISREERNKINENWQRIIAECSRLQRQINILAGGQEVDELLERINTAVQNAEMTTAEMQELIAEVDIKLSEIQTAIINVNNATDDANALNMALTALKSELEKLKSNLTQSESVRQSNEATRINNENNRISAETTRENNEQSRIDAENTRNSNEATRESNETTRQENEANRQTQFNDKINEINTLLPNLQGLENAESWNNSTQYHKNNIVEFNGSSFMALQDSLGQQPPTLPTKQNEYWSLLAQRGVDGTGAVSTVNGISPDVNGNVPLTASDVGAYVKPTNGIPSTDLDSSVQSSLEKANTALQNVPDASTTAKGVVQLNDTLTSTSATEALTANQGKVLDDKINVLTEDLNTTNNNLSNFKIEVNEHLANVVEKGEIIYNVADYATVQDAVDASAGGTLLFPPGTWTASQIIVSSSMKWIASPGSELKQVASSNRNFIQIASDNVDFIVNGLKIDQNNSGQSAGSGKFLFNCENKNVNIEFHNVLFTNFCEGAVRVKGNKDQGTREVLRLFNCKFRGGTESESAIYNTFTVFVADAAEIVVCDCDFDHGINLVKAGIPAITIAGVDTATPSYSEVTIKNNRFSGYGRFSEGSGVGVIDFYAWAENVDISGNKFYRSRVTPIRGKVNARSVIVHGNIIVSSFNSGVGYGNGISLVAATLSPTDGKYIIANNNILDCPEKGIEVSASGTAPDSIIIHDNEIISCGNIGIHLNLCSNFILHDNIVKNAGQQGMAFANCSGYGKISGNRVLTSSLTGISSIGSQLNLDILIHDNFVEKSVGAGITVENVNFLSLQDNTVKDVVDGGASGQRGYRVGGATGITIGQIKNNTAIGTYTTAVFAIISAGFTTSLYEYGNSWNRREAWGTSTPTTGSWSRGDIVWNTLPSESGSIGWICTTAGTPGTWKSFGTIGI